MTREEIVDGLYRGDSKAIEEAINVLQQAPCADCVSRQSVVYIIKSYIHEIITESGMDKNARMNNVLRLIADLISTMQPVTPSQGWIPCSEGLLEVPKDYVYDTETADFVVYRNKYSGDEIHIKKPTPTYTSDVISKQALYEALYEHFHDDDAPNNITEVTLGSVRNFVKNFPSAEPTHGTCKDCAMKRLDKSESEEVGAEKYFCPVLGNYVDETSDFYCAAFEKRDIVVKEETEYTKEGQ